MSELIADHKLLMSSFLLLKYIKDRQQRKSHAGYCLYIVVVLNLILSCRIGNGVHRRRRNVWSSLFLVILFWCFVFSVKQSWFDERLCSSLLLKQIIALRRISLAHTTMWDRKYTVYLNHYRFNQKRLKTLCFSCIRI